MNLINFLIPCNLSFYRRSVKYFAKYYHQISRDGFAIFPLYPPVSAAQITLSGRETWNFPPCSCLLEELKVFCLFSYGKK